MIEVSKTSKSDLRAIEDIAHARNLAPWSADDLLNELTRPDSLFLKATRDSLITGFIIGRIIPSVRVKDGLDAEIYNLAVVPVEERRGVGSMLMQSFFEECQNRFVLSVWLEVRSGNSTAIGFYSKHNFEPVTVRKSFYRDPIEDAIIMRSDLYRS